MKRPGGLRSGPTDAEVMAFGILPEWDEQTARKLRKGDRLLWVHTKRSRYSSLDPADEKLLKRVTVTGETDELILTDFGKYRFRDGRNHFEACGCKRFCDCYGRLYLFASAPSEPDQL